MSCLLCTSRQLLYLQNNSGCGHFTVPLRPNCLAPSFLLETAPAPGAYAPSPLLKAGAQESLLAPLCSLSFTFHPSSNPVRYTPEIPWKHPTRLHPSRHEPSAWVAPPGAHTGGATCPGHHPTPRPFTSTAAPVLLLLLVSQLPSPHNPSSTRHPVTAYNGHQNLLHLELNPGSLVQLQRPGANLFLPLSLTPVLQPN